MAIESIDKSPRSSLSSLCNWIDSLILYRIVFCLIAHPYNCLANLSSLLSIKFVCARLENKMSLFSIFSKEVSMVLFKRSISDFETPTKIATAVSTTPRKPVPTHRFRFRSKPSADVFRRVEARLPPFQMRRSNTPNFSTNHTKGTNSFFISVIVFSVPTLHRKR